MDFDSIPPLKALYQFFFSFKLSSLLLFYLLYKNDIYNT